MYAKENGLLYNFNNVSCIWDDNAKTKLIYWKFSWSFCFVFTETKQEFCQTEFVMKELDKNML